MQTFLPYPKDFDECARVLDTKRLGKQRVEAFQILRANLGMSIGWRNHPATLMWRNYSFCLGDYLLAMCHEWVSRGYKDSIRDKYYESIFPIVGRPGYVKGDYWPNWIDDDRLLYTHRANLFLKNPVHYEFWGIYADDYLDNACCQHKPNPCSYWWPTHEVPKSLPE